MSFEQQISGIRVSMPMTRREINSDISEDFTIPDYCPEIRKVLCVWECLLTPAKFISGSKVDVSGVIDYTLVYVGSDGALCSAPMSGEYSFSLPLENMADFEISEGLTVMANSVCDTSSVRVSAPRRLQIRSRLRTFVSVWGKKLCGETLMGLDEENLPMRLCETSECADIICESSDVITITDDYTLPSSDWRIGMALGNVSVGDTHVEGEVLKIEGEAIIRILLVNDAEGKTEKVIRRLPFEGESDLDGIELSDDTLSRASGNITDLTINVEEGTAHIEANLVLEVCSAVNSPVTYATDVYSTAQCCETEHCNVTLPLMLENKNTSFSQNERIPLVDCAVPEDAEPIDISAWASIDSVAFENGRCVLRGTCRYSVICKRDDEYLSSEIKMPMRYECDFDSKSNPVNVDGTATANAVRVKKDGEDLCIDCELELSYSVWGEHVVDMLERAEFGEPVDKQKGRIVVCYPSPEDTAWSIAKRYHVSQDEIEGDPLSDPFVIIEL